ncbi:glycosyltransferase [Rheinheimera sp. D18]|uniref:glycosyltransferase n=1 Tax=Rheinheimera sp. D18 TaxID=2545632 RepID=UPI0010431C93|nr:glycosyltransferase [Rheinheimera sp. D18]QBL09794.1 glycosyltransferase [Rheinheimera sp. D18]
MLDPLVTIYIPTHNRPEMLARALKSAIEQEYSNIEIIVVDDGSTEENYVKVAELCKRYNNVILLRQQTSAGACAARNLAITTASGQFITGLDDDDEFLPGRISAFVVNWHKLTSPSLLCTGYRFILPGGAVVCSGGTERSIDRARIFHINDVGNQVFTRTAYLRQISGFDTALVACQDYDVWMRLITTFGTGYRLALVNYVVHQEHDSPRISQFDKRLRGHNQLINKYQAVLTTEQLRSQRFFCALYGGEKNLWRLLKLSGWRHLLVLVKFMLARAMIRHDS